MKTLLHLCLLAGLGAMPVLAQTTSFTYQGRLAENGMPATGLYELRFRLLTDPAAGVQVGPTLDLTNTVIQGEFTAALDFGPGLFTGPDRWLEIAVRTNGSLASHVPLAPRQPMLATPYAQHAGTASNLLGQVGDAQLSTNILRRNLPASLSGTLTFNPLSGPPFLVSNATKVAQLNADLLDDLDSTAFARTNHVHDASNLVSGVLADARLSANVVRLSSNQVFLASNRFSGVLTATNPANSFAGNGGGLTNLNGAGVTGTLPLAALPGGVALLGATQSFSGTVTFNPASGAPFRVASPALITNLNADLIDGLSSAAFWNTGGNSNASGSSFLGTLDNSTLELRANNSPALRLAPNPLGANLVVGHPGNSAPTNFGGAVVLGGMNNVASNHFAFVGGGTGNRVQGASAAVLAGDINAATNAGAVVLGGTGNVAGGVNSVAAGAGASAVHSNTLVFADGSSALTFNSTAPNQVLLRAANGVGIGTNNPQAALHVAGTVQSSGFKLTANPQSGGVLVGDGAGNAAWQPPAVRAQTNLISPNTLGGYGGNSNAPGLVGTTIGGGGALGASNYVGGNYGTVSGGRANAANGPYSFIGGGDQNRATGTWSVATGGSNNLAAAEWATVSGGASNTVSGAQGTIGGGFNNAAAGSQSSVAGGLGNVATAAQATIGGGNLNRATGPNAVVGGGDQNLAGINYATVSGGRGNTNLGFAGVIGGGWGNQVLGTYATVAGGFSNVASGLYAFAAGRQAQAAHDGSFVWADNSLSIPFASSAANQFLIRAAGGVGIGTGAPANPLDVAAPGRVSGGVAGFNEVVARLLNPTVGTHTAAAVDALAGQDAVLYFSENGSAVWGLRNDAQPEDQFQLRYHGNATGPVYLAVHTNGAMRLGSTGFEERLSLAGGVVLDSFNTNNNNLAGGIRFGSGSGEGIASKRTSGTGQSNLVFYTRNTARVTIANDGSVGLGTTPANPLTVAGLGTSTGGVSGQNDVVSYHINGTLGNSAVAVGSFFGDSIYYLSRGNAALWGLRNNFPAGDQFQLRHEPSGTVALAVNGGGSVGLGTTSPTDRLSVANGLRLDANDQNAGTRDNALRFGGDGTGEAIGSQRSGDINNGAYGLDFYTGAGGQNRMHIANNGNVGIGTRSPGARLDVQGSVRVGVNGTVLNKIQSGTFTVGGGNNGVNIRTLTFPASFGSTPKVTLTARGQDFPDTFAISTRAISTTAVTFNVVRVDSPGGSWGQPLQVDWFAWE